MCLLAIFWFFFIDWMLHFKVIIDIVQGIQLTLINYSDLFTYIFQCWDVLFAKNKQAIIFGPLFWKIFNLIFNIHWPISLTQFVQNNVFFLLENIFLLKLKQTHAHLIFLQMHVIVLVINMSYSFSLKRNPQKKQPINKNMLD